VMGFDGKLFCAEAGETAKQTKDKSVTRVRNRCMNFITAFRPFQSDMA
jgi:hypothetical protein